MNLRAIPSAGLRSVVAILIAALMVVAQFGMSQAMSAMHPDGVAVHETQAHGDTTGLHTRMSDHGDHRHDDGHASGNDDHHDTHCGAVCISALIPLGSNVTVRLATEIRFPPTRPSEAAASLGGLKRPPRS